MKKIAISQPTIFYGGRLRVLIGITSVLNQLGIIPTWLTCEMPGELETISAKYGVDFKFKVKIFPQLRVRDPGEFGLTRFNRIVSKWCAQNQFDWLFNSSNTIKGFSNFENVVSYVHFPREARASSPLADIHDPNSIPNLFSKKAIRKHATRLNYRIGRVRRSHRIIANSNFTKTQFLEYYGSNQVFDHEIRVIYPFAITPDPTDKINEERESAIASLGSFCAAKRQLEQASIGSELEQLGLKIWIMGHAKEENQYLEKVRQVALEQKVVNVLPNLSYADVQSHLRRCRYFLHTNINEPFGIATVEAVLNGAVPLVHNSGGQKEIVESELLRFDNVSKIPEKLTQLECSNYLRQQLLDGLTKKALDHFTESVFESDFHDYLNCIFY